jgi:NAD-dependent dihydropyrimidine dehydrogenase PreA subunit
VTYVITGNCIKEDSCVGVCPMDCIHPRPDAPDFATAEQLYIDAASCIDCDACVEACPVDAIYSDVLVPEQHRWMIDVNERFFSERTLV